VSYETQGSSQEMVDTKFDDLMAKISITTTQE